MLLQIDPIKVVETVKDIADTQENEITGIGLAILCVVALGIVLWRTHFVIHYSRKKVDLVNEQRIKDLKEYAEDLVDLHDKTNVSLTQMIELIKQIRYDSKR